jgi:protein ImuB
VEPVDPRVIQHGLFLPLAPEPEKLELTLARIANLVGENKVGSPELVDSHRPGAFRINRFVPLAASERSAGNGSCRHLALRVFRPPLPAKIRAESGRPGWISARGVRGKVVSLAGPWRSSGDWWAGDAWNRDEWDVALSDGALYRIYCDRQSGAWFVEGRYD